ncbi:hypothetical protein AB1285_23070 [Microbacterium sp. NRRL B-14842]|uniref:hypothetical protein n=1 Tax=Microbacterium sp. NRRL B-14842 TaxID=3162881 RepID=UPI003D2E2D42
MRTHTCPPDHKHGLTSTCYVVHLCGCRACMDGNARRRRDRYRLLAYGRYQDAHQPIEPIRQHLQALVDTGMIPERIAISAGVGGATVRRLLNSETARFVTGATARKLLAVTPDSSTLAAQGRVNGRGTRRRLQALAAIGWNHHEIARRLGYPRWKVNKALEGAYVDIRVHDDIAALYDELWDQQPPTHTRAQRVGRSYALTSHAGTAGCRRWPGTTSTPTRHRPQPGRNPCSTRSRSSSLSPARTSASPETSASKPPDAGPNADSASPTQRPARRRRPHHRPRP